MDKMQIEISKNIALLMEEQSLNIKSLSSLSTLSEKTISKLLNCELQPTISILQKICNVFNLNTCEFFDEIIATKYLNLNKKEVI